MSKCPDRRHKCIAACMFVVGMCCLNTAFAQATTATALDTCTYVEQSSTIATETTTTTTTQKSQQKKQKTSDTAAKPPRWHSILPGMIR